MHVPGRIHVGPDTLSRKEVSSVVVAMLGFLTEPAEDNMDDTIEAEVAGNFLATGGQVAAVSPAPITWAQVKGEVSKDQQDKLLPIGKKKSPNRAIIRPFAVNGAEPIT